MKMYRMIFQCQDVKDIAFVIFAHCVKDFSSAFMYYAQDIKFTPNLLPFLSEPMEMYRIQKNSEWTICILMLGCKGYIKLNFWAPV